MKITRGFVLLALLIVLVFIALSFWWYKSLFPPLSNHVLQAEQALANNLIGLAQLDMNQVKKIQASFTGPIDPDAIPMQPGTQSALIEQLLDETSVLNQHSEAVLIGLYVGETPADSGAVTALVGEFVQSNLVKALEKAYTVQALDQNTFELTPLPQEKPIDPAACPSDDKHKGANVSLYWVHHEQVSFISDKVSLALQARRRLEENNPAVTDLAQWQKYREGALATAMLFAPDKTWQASQGMTAMMAKQAAKNLPQINQVAARLDFDLLSQGIDVKLILGTEDSQWAAKTADEYQAKLAELGKDSARVSPTFNRLLSRIQIDSTQEALAVDLSLDESILEDISSVVQEGMASLFSVEAKDPSQSVGPDKIQTHPKDYAANAVLANLPDITFKDHETPALFYQGPFAADIKQISQTDDGLFEIWIEAKVAIPESQNWGREYTAETTFIVDSITDQQGNELLRDERCVTGMMIHGKNQEPSSNTMINSDTSSAWKRVRLIPDAQLEKIHRIEGNIEFTAPVSVSVHDVPLKAGASVEAEGVRFYINHFKDSQLTYQLSGDTDRVLEIRALNSAGQPLETSWKMGSVDPTGQQNQAYQGKIASVQVFIARQFNQQSMQFVITDPLKAPVKKDPDAAPQYFAPDTVDVSQWDSYKELDWNQLKLTNHFFGFVEKNTKLIGDLLYPNLRILVTHNPESWSRNPNITVFFPLLEPLPGVLSAMSFTAIEPAVQDEPATNYSRISYPYYTNSGKLAINTFLDE
ncbi:MAG: hypothetical protein KJO91_05145, partial [Gammaproteobacteria bacterium]|nr:hypothetical protein [Gammaproteobacteria bacterium]